MLGTGLTAVYFLILLNRAFSVASDSVLDLPRAVVRTAFVVVLAVLIVLLGIQPSWLISRSEATIATLEPAQDWSKRWLLIRPLPFP